MYDKTMLGVLEQIYVAPGIHQRGISKQLRLSMPSVDNALKKLGRIVENQKSANQFKYYINYSKEALVPLLYGVEYLRVERLPARARIAIRNFLRELEEKPILALIFGSYAKGNYTNKSDIDILLVFQNIDNARTIENAAKRISMNTNTKISPVYLGYENFKESFHNPTKDFFKNIKKNKILLVGIEWWRYLENEEA